MTSWARTVPALDRPDDPQHVEPVPPDLLEVDAAASRGVERAVVRPGRVSSGAPERPFNSTDCCCSCSSRTAESSSQYAITASHHSDRSRSET